MLAASVLYGCSFVVLLSKGAPNEWVLLKYFYSFAEAELNNIESKDEVFAHEFSYEESNYGDNNDEDI